MFKHDAAIEKKRNIRKQLYLMYSLSIFIPILAIGSFLIINNYSLIYKHHRDMMVSDNLRVRSIIFEVTTSLTNICDNISDDPLLQKFLSTQYTSYDEAQNSLKGFKAMEDYYGKHTEVSSITLYTSNSTLHNYGHIRMIDDTISLEPWFQEALNKPGYFWTTLMTTNLFNVPYQELRLVHKIPIKGNKEQAVLVITVSNNYLKNRIDNNKLDVDIAVNKDPIFYSTWGQASNPINFPINYEETYFKYSGYGNYRDPKELMEISTFKPIKSQDKLYILSLDPNALIEIRRVLVVTTSIVLISVIIPLILIVKYTRQFSNRVETLRSEMHRVSNGDYNIIENFKGNDELVELFIDLKQMIKSIKKRDEAIFDARINEQKLINHQQQMELEILSSKINPHFLYNTLETIRMKAFDVDDLEVAEAVKLLGKYMRHNLESTGGITSLAAELEFILVYLKIQKLRFTSRIDYVIKIEEDLHPEKIMILPLLIQPIIENAFIHGHEETIEDGIIELHIHADNDILSVLVIDNGIGVSTEKLDSLRMHLVSDTKPVNCSFGLYNIHQRIRLFYGNDYGLTIDGKLGQGTSVGFRIPIVMKTEV